MMTLTGEIDFWRDCLMAKILARYLSAAFKERSEVLDGDCVRERARQRRCRGVFLAPQPRLHRVSYSGFRV